MLKPMAPDTIGYGPRHTRFPGSSECTHVPYDESSHLLNFYIEFQIKNFYIKFLYYIEDELLESFLSLQGGQTDQGIFGSTQKFHICFIYVPNSNMCPSVDKGLRAQLADNLVTDELMDIIDKLFTIALDIRKYSKDYVPGNCRSHHGCSPLINTSVILSAASNLRGRHTTLTSIV